MSKSIKKNPIISDYSRSSTRFHKGMASRAVRRYKGIISDGSSFKKVYPTWNIHDYIWWGSVSDEHIKHPDRNPEDYYGTTHKDMAKFYRK